MQRRGLGGLGQKGVKKRERMCFRLERSEGSISLLSCSPGCLVHNKHTVGTNKYLCWVDASGANLVLLQSLFKTLPMFSFFFFIIWVFFAPMVKFFLYVSQVTLRGETGPGESSKNVCWMNKRYQRSSAKDTRGQTWEVLRKREEEGMGGERTCALSIDAAKCDLQVSPSRWASGSHWGTLERILIIHGFLMLKFNQENLKQHSSLVSQPWFWWLELCFFILIAFSYT